MEFTSIWKELKNPLENFIKTKISSSVEAEDVLQEVSIKLLDNLDKKTQINNYQTWTFQVARNTISDFYRKKGQSSREVSISNQIDIPATNCVCDLSGFVIQNYLPAEYGTALYLSDIEKIPQKEIAEILNISLTATKSRIQRARKKLKTLILECVTINYNSKGQITGFKLKNDCNLPKELLVEAEKLKLLL
ncbi:sigma factor-like helix-turn-helix DNA-binding protein [Aquimarina sp. 2201CG1-2-11]|uniref:sigma factor-like helix-turn-helix DNA-binding protein n=1 Tax=Aquimarina discodermiae TaxID=3231043 RepID=UPI003462C99C